MVDQEGIVKLRIKYEKGSQTFRQCDPTVSNATLLEVGQAIASLRADNPEEVEYLKITETDLFDEL